MKTDLTSVLTTVISSMNRYGGPLINAELARIFRSPPAQLSQRFAAEFLETTSAKLFFLVNLTSYRNQH